MPKSVRYLALIAVLTAGMCTTIMNWRFAFQLAPNPFDAHVWAVFSVALDVCKWTMLPYAAAGWPAHKLRSVAAAAIWITATSYSFGAALGFTAITRDAAIAERQSQSQVHSTLRTMRQSPRWQSSAACADATAKASKDFCSAYQALEAKLSATPVNDDPQADLIARLSGLTQERARLVLAFFLAIACELVSALGFFAISMASLAPKPHLAPTSHKTGEAPDRSEVPANLVLADDRRAPQRWRPRQK